MSRRPSLTVGPSAVPDRVLRGSDVAPGRPAPPRFPKYVPGPERQRDRRSGRDRRPRAVRDPALPLGHRPRSRADGPDAAAGGAAAVRRRVRRPPRRTDPRADHDRRRPVPLRPARGAGRADLRRRRVDPGHDRDRGPVRGRARLLSARLRRARPADRAGDAPPGGPGPDPVDPEPGRAHRPGSRHGARARLRRRGGLHPRRADLRAQCRVADAGAPARAWPAGVQRREHDVAGPARGLAGGPCPSLGVGHDRRVHRGAALRLRAVVRAGPV